MVSPEQIELLRRSMETNDFDTLPLLYHDDMELRETDRGGGVHRGLPAYTAYFKQLFQQIEYVWTEVEEINQNGDYVLAYTQGDMRDRQTDVVVHLKMGILFVFRGDKISLVEPFLDRAKAYEAWRARSRSESDHSSGCARPDQRVG